jgi:membrane protein involved in colicin uptake
MINVNAPDEASLLNVPTLMNLAMFADRKGDPESTLRRLRTAIKLSRRLTEDERLQLKDWILDVLLKKARSKLSKKETARIKKLFDNKEDADMTYALEKAIDEIERRGRQDERKKAAAKAKAERKAAEAKMRAGLEKAETKLKAEREAAEAKMKAEHEKAETKLKAEREAAEAKMKAEREAAVSALRAAGVSDEIIEKAYPDIANPTSL